MHDHKNGKGNKSMMWMMAICCGLLLLIILVVGGGGKVLGASNWIIFGGIALMVLTHFFMMGKHKDSDNSNEKEELPKKEDKNKEDKTHSGHGCCH